MKLLSHYKVYHRRNSIAKSATSNNDTALKTVEAFFKLRQLLNRNARSLTLMIFLSQDKEFCYSGKLKSFQTLLCSMHW